MRRVLDHAGPREASTSRQETRVQASSQQSIVIAGAFGILLLTALLSLMGWHEFDYTVMGVFNSLSRRSAVFDYVVRALTRDMLSNVLMVTLVWWAWFSTRDRDLRAGILVGVIVSFVAGTFSRGLQLTLPTHLRPLHDPSLQFRVPIGIDPATLNNWSSFPSDHATVLFGLAATVFLANRRVGLAALALACGLNCVRIYLGFHFPTDVAGGAMLGIIFVTLTQRVRFSKPARRLMALESSRMPLFYAGWFYFCFGVATLFVDYRDSLADLVQALH